MNHVSERLKEIGKNQSWLAQKIGLSKGHVSDLANNRIQNPRVQTVIKIAEAFGSLSEIDHLWDYKEN